MKQTIIFLTLALSLMSCKKAYLALNGVRKPRFETVESVNNKLYSYDHSYILLNSIPKDSLTFIHLLHCLHGLPSNLVFDHNGILIDQRDKKYCAGRSLKFALQLDPTDTLILDSTVTLHAIMDDLILNGTGVNAASPSPDFTVLIFWANFLGRANNNVFGIMEEMKRRRDIKVNYLLVNMDVQQSWGMKTIPYKFQN